MLQGEHCKVQMCYAIPKYIALAPRKNHTVGRRMSSRRTETRAVSHIRGRCQKNIGTRQLLPTRATPFSSAQDEIQVQTGCVAENLMSMLSMLSMRSSTAET